MPSIRKMSREEIETFNEKDDLGVNSALPPVAPGADNDADDWFIIGLTKFIMGQKSLTTRRLRAKITAATKKAVMVEAHALVGESDSCHRCGRELTHPASRLVGYGVECVWEVGLGALWERYAETLETDMEAFRLMQQAAQRLSIISDWLPLSQISIREPGSDKSLRYPDDQDEIYALLRGLGLLRPDSPEDVEVELHAGTSEWNGIVYDNVFVKASKNHLSILRAIKDRHRGSGFDPARLMWRYPLTEAVIDDITSSFGNMITFVDPVIVSKFMQREERQSTFKALTDAELTQPAEINANMWLHQKQALAFGQDLTGVGYFLDMGTGKTLVAIAEIIESIKSGGMMHLIVAPKAVIKDVWPREIERFCGLPVHVASLTRIGTPAKALDAINAWRAAKARKLPLIILVNYDSAYRDPLGEWLLSQEWDTITADEVHRIKSPGGMTSKFMAKLASKGKKRLGLTGTPMPHSPMDVWAIYRFIDRNVLQSSFYEFRSRYAILQDVNTRQTVTDDDGEESHRRVKFSVVKGYRNQAELNSRIYSVGFRVMKSEALDLPEVMHTYLKCDLDRTSREMYESMKSDLVAQYEDAQEDGSFSVSAKNILVKLLRLQQITSGHIVDDDGIIRELGNSKEKLLGEVVEDIDASKPIVVITRFKADVQAVKRVAIANDRPFLQLDGDINQLDQYIAGNNGNGFIIAVNERSGGVGVNLTWSGKKATEYCIFYSLSYSLGDFDQTLARVHRGGMGDVKIQYIHLQASNSIDTIIYRALDARRDDVEFVLNMLSRDDYNAEDDNYGEK